MIKLYIFISIYNLKYKNIYSGRKTPVNTVMAKKKTQPKAKHDR